MMKYLYGFKQQFGRIKALSKRQKSRRDLLRLNDEALADIGVTREMAQAEGSKPFWR